MNKAKISKEEKRLNELEDRYMNMSEEDLRHLADCWYPSGSGPIGAMYTITALVRLVAKLRGIDITKEQTNAG
jgi:hypothetical protein